MIQIPLSGYDLPSIDSEHLISEADAGGVTMGADLVAEMGRTPAFIVWALRDGEQVRRSSQP